MAAGMDEEFKANETLQTGDHQGTAALSSDLKRKVFIKTLQLFQLSFQVQWAGLASA